MVQIGRQPPPGRGVLGDDLAQHGAQIRHALPGECGGGEHDGPVLAVLADRESVLVEQPSQVVEDQVRRVPRQPVDLIEHQHGHIGVPGQGAQIALVQCRVGVLLRVQHPDDDVHQPQQAVHLLAVTGGGGVVVGEVDQYQPVEALILDTTEVTTGPGGVAN